MDCIAHGVAESDTTEQLTLTLLSSGSFLKSMLAVGGQSVFTLLALWYSVVLK